MLLLIEDSGVFMLEGGRSEPRLIARELAKGYSGGGFWLSDDLVVIPVTDKEARFEILNINTGEYISVNKEIQGFAHTYSPQGTCFLVSDPVTGKSWIVESSGESTEFNWGVPGSSQALAPSVAPTVQFSPDGDSVITSSCTLNEDRTEVECSIVKHMLENGDVADNKRTITLPKGSNVQSMRLSPDGTLLIISDEQRNQFILVNMNEMRIIDTIPWPETISAPLFMWSPDSELIGMTYKSVRGGIVSTLNVLSGEERIILTEEDSTLLILDWKETTITPGFLGINSQ